MQASDIIQEDTNAQNTHGKVVVLGDSNFTPFQFICFVEQMRAELVENKFFDSRVAPFFQLHPTNAYV